MATYREVFREIMHYGSFDHIPAVHWCGWPETRTRWLAEGMPADADECRFFGVQPYWGWVSVNLDLFPLFSEEVFEETDEYRVVRAADGVVNKHWKGKSSIPHFIDFTLKTAADWPEYKKRLQPDPARLPADLDQRLADAQARELPLVVNTASLMGWIRNWMGVENMSFLMYDDRDVYSDMVMTIADLVCWELDLLLPKVKVDVGFGWEDICGKSGPLVSPDIFDECVAPGYRKIRNKLEQYGVDLYGIDSDGDVSRLVGHWLDAGVNMQFPIEVGTWKGDANDYRKKYGRELRIVGNFDKMVLESDDFSGVTAEFERLRPLMKDGGFLLLPDHLITPGTSLANYRRFLEYWKNFRPFDA